LRRLVRLPLGLRQEPEKKDRSKSYEVRFSGKSVATSEHLETVRARLALGLRQKPEKTDRSKGDEVRFSG